MIEKEITCLLYSIKHWIINPTTHDTMTYGWQAGKHMTKRESNEIATDDFSSGVASNHGDQLTRLGCTFAQLSAASSL